MMMQEDIAKSAEELKIIDSHKNIVFFGEQAFRRKAAFRISEARTAFTTSSTNIRPRQSSAIHFSSVIQKILSLLQR